MTNYDTRETRSSAALFTTNPTWIGKGSISNLPFQGSGTICRNTARPVCITINTGSKRKRVASVIYNNH
jgi:hypothetical protein